MPEPSGLRSREPFAHFDPDTSSWKMSQQSLLQELDPNSPEPPQAWPRSGTWDLGCAYARPTSARPTAANGSSSRPPLLKTPTAQLAVNGGSQHPDKRKRGGARPDASGRDRAPAVALLPTPRSSDTNGIGQHGTGGVDLRTAVHLLSVSAATPYGNNQSDSPGAAVRPSLDGLAQLLPTPTATDSKASGGGKPSDVTLTDATVRQAERFGQYAAAIARWTPIIGRDAPSPTVLGSKGKPRLNPVFVEWMMGLPDGWVTAAPGIARNQQLKALGNGVVPAQCYEALRRMHRGGEVGE